MKTNYDIGEMVYFTDAGNEYQQGSQRAILNLPATHPVIYRGEVQQITLKKKYTSYKVVANQGTYILKEDKMSKTINGIKEIVTTMFEEAITLKSNELDIKMEDFVNAGVAGKIKGKKKVSKYDGEYDIKSGGKKFTFTEEEVEFSDKPTRKVITVDLNGNKTEVEADISKKINTGKVEKFSDEEFIEMLLHSCDEA